MIDRLPMDTEASTIPLGGRKGIDTRKDRWDGSLSDAQLAAIPAELQQAIARARAESLALEDLLSREQGYGGSLFATADDPEDDDDPAR